MRSETEACPRCGDQQDWYQGHGNYRRGDDGLCTRCGRTRSWHAGTTCFCRYATGMPLSILLLDEALEAVLAVRVAAHHARGGANATRRGIVVEIYKHALKSVRDVEDTLEAWRRDLGATSSVAYRLSTTEEQLVLEIA